MVVKIINTIKSQSAYSKAEQTNYVLIQELQQKVYSCNSFSFTFLERTYKYKTQSQHPKPSNQKAKIRSLLK